MYRRDLLVRTGLLLGAGLLAAAPSPALGNEPTTSDDWGALRDQFELSRDWIHMGGLYLASHPAPVREAIERHRRGLDENPVHYLQERGPRLEAAVLRAAADYLGGAPADIALTDSTTMGLGLLYDGLAVRADQEMLTSEHDFASTHESLRVKAARSGAALCQVRLYDDPAAASEDAIVETLRAAVTPRTRVVALTWVHSSSGVKLPIRRIADALAELNRGRDEVDRALLCVDGVHGLGVEEAAAASLGCDFFVAGCHKWLFGPRGTGLVWGTPGAWAQASPTIPTFSDPRVPGRLHTPGGFHSFEHRWALAEAFGLHLAIGRDRVAARVHELARQLKDGLAALPRVRLYTPLDPALSGGLVCFDLRGLAARAVVARLRERGIVATTTPYATSYARLAPGLLNSPGEVETTLAAVRALA
jgi:selenocysteine lyase/cysteine desulfurase